MCDKMKLHKIGCSCLKRPDSRSKILYKFKLDFIHAKQEDLEDGRQADDLRVDQVLYKPV